MLRQTSIIITWNDDQRRPNLIDGDEWAYTLRMGGVDVEHVIVGEDLPHDGTLPDAIAVALEWAERQ